MLTEAVRTVALLDELDAVILSEGAVVDSPQDNKANPAAVEARQQRIVAHRRRGELPQPVGGATAVVTRLVTPHVVRAGRLRIAVSGVAPATAEKHHDGGTTTGAPLAELGGTLTRG